MKYMNQLKGCPNLHGMVKKDYFDIIELIWHISSELSTLIYNTNIDFCIGLTGQINNIIYFRCLRLYKL